MSKYVEHQTVILNRDIPDEELEKGAMGTIVHIYGSFGPVKAYAVEFPFGGTSTVVTLTEDDLDPPKGEFT